eukprot:275617_1
MLSVLGRGAAWKWHRAVGINLIVGARAKSSSTLKRKAVVAILGAEAEKNSSSMMGTKDGPDHIRQALMSNSLNSTTEQFVNIHHLYKDYGNINEDAYETTEEFHETLRTRICDIVGHGLVPVTLGGDHSITNPLVIGRAAADNPSEFAIVHLDAHMDVYEDYEGNPFSHASPFARILEASPSVCTKLIQIGIRSTTFHQRIEQANRYGIEVMDMKTITTSNDTLNKINKILPPDSPIYLSLSAIEILFDKRNILITQISIFFLLTLFPTFNFKCVASIWMLWTLLMYLE